MSDEAKLESLEHLKNTVGPSEPQVHQGGYLSQNEYATLIYYWADPAGHEPGLVDGIIATLANCGWAQQPERDLPVAGAVMAFEELYPDKATTWWRAHGELFHRVGQALSIPNERVEWCDFHIAQWFILRGTRRDEAIDILDKLLDRVAEGGMVGFKARERCEVLALCCKPFQVALRRAQEARIARMVIY